jgi:hypothetical protein
MAVAVFGLKKRKINVRDVEMTYHNVSECLGLK